jgi:3-oxoacyl-[acyl-carrier protein] reductase
VVVAKASIAHRVPLVELTDDKWDHTHDVDLKGVMGIGQASAPAMRAAGHGTMIAVSSIMGVAYGWHEHVLVLGRQSRRGGSRARLSRGTRR